MAGILRQIKNIWTAIIERFKDAVVSGFYSRVQLKYIYLICKHDFVIMRKWVANKTCHCV